MTQLRQRMKEKAWARPSKRSLEQLSGFLASAQCAGGEAEVDFCILTTSTEYRFAWHVADGTR